MKKMILILLSMIFFTVSLAAEDVVLVAVKVKIDAYSAKDMKYLGVFADLKDTLKPTCMTVSKDGKLIVAGSPVSFDSPSVVIKLNKDGSLDKVLFTNDSYNSPIRTPKSIVELDDGSLVLFDIGSKKIFKISANGNLEGEFIASDAEKSDPDRITSIFDYEGDIVVASSDPANKLVEYDQNGNFVTNLTDGNEYIKKPIHISKAGNGYIMIASASVDVGDVKKQISTLIQLDNDLMFVKKLIADTDIEKKTLLRPTLAIKNKVSGKYIIIDEGRNRGTTKSYDDNLELFSSDGKYEKSLGTYEDTLLRSIIWFEGSTKKW